MTPENTGETRIQIIGACEEKKPISRPRAPKTKRKMHVDMTPSVQKTIVFKTPKTTEGKKKSKKQKKGYKAWLRKALNKKSAKDKKKELEERLLTQAIKPTKVDMI